MKIFGMTTGLGTHLRFPDFYLHQWFHNEQCHFIIQWLTEFKSCPDGNTFINAVVISLLYIPRKSQTWSLLVILIISVTKRIILLKRISYFPIHCFPKDITSYRTSNFNQSLGLTFLSEVVAVSVALEFEHPIIKSFYFSSCYKTKVRYDENICCSIQYLWQPPMLYRLRQ